MEVRLPIHAITIKDEQSGEEISVKTLRTVKEIAGYIEETENDELTDRVGEVVSDALNSDDYR